MAERSKRRGNAQFEGEQPEVFAPRAHGPGRGWLATGLVLVAIVAAGIAWGLGVLRDDPGPGRLFYAGPQGIYERDLASDDVQRVARIPDLVIASVSPDGRWIASVRGGRLVVTDLTDDDFELVVSERLTVPLGWAPDGRLVAGELLSDGDLIAVDPEGAREVLYSGYARGSMPVWFDDERFAVARSSEEVVIVEDGETVASTEGFPLAVSADGAELLLQRDDEVVVTKVDGTSFSDPRKIFEGRVDRAATSRSGLVAITGEDARERGGIWVFEGGTDVRRIVNKKADWLGWSAESSHLLYARKGAVHAMRLPDGKPQRVSRKDVDVFPLFSFTVVP